MTFWPPVSSCATPRIIAAAAMVVTIGSVRAAPISSPWTSPVRMPNATAIPRAAHGPRCRVAANRMAALATTALSDRENIRPTMVMMLSPTATIPTRETESTSARKLFVVANSGTNTQARMNRITVTAPMTAGPSRFSRQRRLVVLPVCDWVDVVSRRDGVECACVFMPRLHAEFRIEGGRHLPLR